MSLRGIAKLGTPRDTVYPRDRKSDVQGTSEGLGGRRIIKREVCHEISAFLRLSDNLRIRVRISTLGFSEPRKKPQKSI